MGGRDQKTRKLNPFVDQMRVDGAELKYWAFPPLVVRTVAAAAQLAESAHGAVPGCQEHVEFSKEAARARMACDCGWRGPAVAL